jgi:hypothetical protein
MPTHAEFVAARPEVGQPELPWIAPDPLLDDEAGGLSRRVTGVEYPAGQQPDRGDLQRHQAL